MFSGLVVALAGLAVAGPASPTPEGRFAQRLNAFGGRLWAAMKPGPGNQAVASLSVGVCMSMLVDAAHAPSRDPLLGTLGFEGLDNASIDQGAAALIGSLKQAGADQFTMSNGVWLRLMSPLNETYRDSIVKNYGGEVRRFASPDASTLQEINDWVKDRTKGRIPSIFDQLDPETSCVLVNAMTFDGKRKTQFLKDATHDDAFRANGGEPVMVPMMHQSGEYVVSTFKRYSSIALPYVGDRFEMLFLLPNASSSPGEALTELLSDSNAQPSETATAKKIAIPTFKIERSYDLKPPLGQLGLAPLYEDAKLGGISPDLDHLTKIDQIQHKTYIKVDEEGTKAAAATGAAVVTRAIMRPTIEFNLDRPFAFAIVDQQTGVIVMMGTVADPRA